MAMKDDIRTVTEMKANAAGLLAQVNREQRPVIITQKGRAQGVLLDPASYEELRAAVGLLHLIAQGQEDLRRGRWIEQGRMFDELDREFASRERRARRKA
jgi:prevent-host-death family protein